MRKLRPFITFIFVLAFFTACKKNMVTEEYTPFINPVIPDFSTQINAAVKGFITDENGNALRDAIVKGGAVTVSTNEYGYFEIATAAFAKSAGFIQVSKAGYFTGYSTFIPVEGKETFTRLQLIPKTTIGTIASGTGGTVTTADGATVTLPANAVVNAATNAAYTGAVNVAVHWLNPSEENKTQLTMPGNLTGIDSAGHLNVLATYGMLAVELSGSSGELLQITPGKKASLHFPLPSALSGIAPSSIPLWYFDETKGIWQQEGRAVKIGNSYEGEVSHFSYWNCDAPFSLVNFTIQVVDSALNPLSNIPVIISVANTPYLARLSFTDTNGVATGLIPANSNLLLEIGTPCYQRISFGNIVTTNAALDMGTVTISLNQYGVVLNGTVTKCNGSPVTDGYLLVTGIGYNSIVDIRNGTFSVAGTACPGSTAYLVAHDRETSLQNTTQALALTAGNNNIAPIQLCSPVLTEIITTEGSAIGNNNYALPQYLFGANFYFANDSTMINAIDLLNGNQQAIQFSFTGSPAAGTYPLSGNSFIYGGLAVVFTTPVSVNVTAYGLTGEFIVGYFSGQASIAGGTPGMVFINFSVKRDQ